MYTEAELKKMQKMLRKYPFRLLVVSTSEDDSSNIVIIVCVVLGLCLLLVLAFILYHYRTRLHHVFKVRAGQPMKSKYDIVTDKSTVSAMRDNRAYDPMTRKAFQNQCNGMSYKNIYFLNFQKETLKEDKIFVPGKIFMAKSVTISLNIFKKTKIVRHNFILTMTPTM